MSEGTITVSEERYKELIKTEVKVELLVGMLRKDRYFHRDDFRAMFDPEYKEEEEK